MNKKGNALYGVTGVAVGVIMLILLYGVFTSLGAKVNNDFQTTSLMCGNGTWNSSAKQCQNSTGTDQGSVTNAGLASLNASAGIVTAGTQTPTIASVGGFVVIIALLGTVAAFALGAFR